MGVLQKKLYIQKMSRAATNKYFNTQILADYFCDYSSTQIIKCDSSPMEVTAACVHDRFCLCVCV